LIFCVEIEQLARRHLDKTRMRRALVLACIASCAAADRAHACATDDEPSLAQLSAAALRSAAIEPSRIRSLIARARRAALLPKVRLSAGRGGYDYIRNADTLEPSIVSSDTWRWEVDVIFSLDRLVFDPHELRAVEAAARVAERRVELLERVAELWAARRGLARVRPGPPGSAPLEEAADQARSAEERCVELTVLLDALTDGALTTAPRSSKSLRDPRARP
jgi:hypothetical protein